MDESDLIALVNKTAGTMEMLTCVSRPRRFGKSYAVKMLCGYFGMNFEDTRHWYDDFPEAGAVCNPYSVMMMAMRKKFAFCWKKMSAAESLMRYINKSAEGAGRFSKTVILPYGRISAVKS